MSLTIFNLAVNYLLDRIEGGGKPITDSGGFTRWGISHRAHPTVDIAHLTREGAVDIYLADYWDKYNLSLLPVPLSLMVFDAGVNMSPPVAIRMLQDILHAKGDGILGEKTADAAADFDQAELRARYSEIRLRYYEGLAKSKPFYTPSLYGWRLRCMRVADEAGRWTGAGVGEPEPRGLNATQP